VKANAFTLLQETDDFEQIIRPRIARRSEHAHEALGGDMRGLGKFRESDGRIDVVPENGLGGGDIAAKHAFDAFAQKLLAEFGIALDAGADCFLEVAGQSHGFLLLSPFIILPAVKSVLDVLLLAFLRAAEQNDEEVSVLAD
jgi:hypothetical protein